MSGVLEKRAAGRAASEARDAAKLIEQGRYLEAADSLKAAQHFLDTARRHAGESK